MKNILDTLGGALGKGGLNNTLGNLAGSAGLGGLAGAGKVGDLLNSGMGKAKEGLSQIPADKLNLGGMLGSAAIGGLLGALFGGKGVAKVAKGALMVGGTAAAGALAWKFYQKWSQSQVTAQTVSVPGQDSGTPPASIPQAAPPVAPSGWPTALQQEAAALPPAENTALLLLEAMIFAARADGHIDEEEQAHIQNATAALFPGQEMHALLEHMLTKPIDPSALAARVQNPEEGRDLYRLSCTAVHVDNFMERSYLDGLAQALGISAEQKAQLEREAEEARREAAQG